MMPVKRMQELHDYECEASNFAGTVGYKVDVSIKGGGTYILKKFHSHQLTAES